ncbi:hypothetical protein EJMOOK_15565 [Rhodanobacter sp. Root179]|uniref:hypothetical protein n=1 Tax=Rhodanobacter sp. Root179 TaxID=1736482 RepID=UPI0006F24893|nr:hypothetical protein [Rhodanobacter sp. Root179]
MLRFLLVFFALEVLGSGAAVWLFKAGRLPVAMGEFLSLHKLLTPVIVALVAPFVALAFAAFWPALGAAIVLSWLYLYFAVATGCALIPKGSDGAVVYLATALWGALAPVVSAASVVLVHLLILIFR